MFNLKQYLDKPIDGDERNRGRISLGPQGITQSSGLDSGIKSLKVKCVYHLLLNALGDEVDDITLNVNDGDAFELWQSVRRIYERNTDANIASVRAKLTRLRMKDGDSFESFRGELVKCATLMQDLGEPLRESEIMNYLTYGLSSIYDPIVQSFAVNNVRNFDDASNFIRDYEEKLKLRNEFEVVNLVRDNKPKVHKHKSSKRVKAGGAKENINLNLVCFICGEKGHGAYECSHRGDIDICDWCKRPYHTQSKCIRYKLYKSRKSKSKRNSEKHTAARISDRDDSSDSEYSTDSESGGEN